jgi:MAGUK p55 subfamily protein 5
MDYVEQQDEQVEHREKTSENSGQSAAALKVLHIRALFNYVPQEDIYIPCKEIGLGFNKGDILHIISQDDDDWWQAYNDVDKDQLLAGLIPSQSFQEKCVY